MPKVIHGAPADASSVTKPKVLVCLFSYGGISQRTFSAMLSELLLMNEYGIKYLTLPLADDALISRSRSKALSAAIQGEFDVCLMVDHDIEWQNGELLALAMKAHITKSCVSGIYSARAIGRGAASRSVNDAVEIRGGEDQLIDAEYLGGGFLAIPRVVAEEVLNAGQVARLALGEPGGTGQQTETAAALALHACAYNKGPPVYDFFRPICVPRTFEKPGLPKLTEAPYEYLSEDWAFSWRCRAANPARPLYLWALPVLLHHGEYGFSMKTAFVGGPPQDEGTVGVNAPKVTL